MGYERMNHTTIGSALKLPQALVCSLAILCTRLRRASTLSVSFDDPMVSGRGRIGPASRAFQPRNR